jgi:hypothetical protein
MSDMCSYCGLLKGSPRYEPLSSASSCFVAWGFGFCRTGLWARPRRPGALGGALVIPRKIWSALRVAGCGPGALCFLPRNPPAPACCCRACVNALRAESSGSSGSEWGHMLVSS